MTPLEKAHAALAAKRAAGETSERTGPLAKLAANPTNRRLAIAAQCVVCLGGDDEHVPYAAIRDCTAPTCPLYAVRPYQRRDGGAS